ncbi:MAG TPA: type I restriction endonuclease [Bryobacteraceae bacterium]|nr:type I restriction endonuclease [Bryobacteraceae bacterium]
MDTSEKDFETTVFEHLCENGYVRREREKYDRQLCLDSEILFSFLYATQPQTWERLKTQHGEQVKERFLRRLTGEIEARGTLDVLRKGVVDLGCKFDLAYFRPESSLNEEHSRLYEGNLLGAMRQVRYSGKNENSLDVVLFVNGLPVITAELKTPLKGQTVQDAVAQYRLDRDTKEPLFRFGRCLAHFAVDTDLAFMTTHLRGGQTHFLPFNQGQKKGSGNPPNPRGFRTAYLWEQVWQKDSLLDILNHFLVKREKVDDKGRKTKEWELIFPRYHQLDAVRRLVRDAKGNGPGRNYLIEHSAGSGKSNTIAWLCHQLAGLHGANNKRVFDSIVVVTDRRVLDWQLRRTIRSFEQVKGVVTAIEKEKSRELAEALRQGKDIIITTLQTFPFVTEKIGELPGHRFAVVVDEAHSSQSGESNRSLKEVLTVRNLEEVSKEEAGESRDEQDVINSAIEAAMKRRGRLENVSFFAFTATPKPKTLELFGTSRPDGQMSPFSLYSMRQAIEEGFIMDVLKNYTTFKVYFALLKKIADDPKYERKEATYLLRSYADLHKHGLRTKSSLMVDHFQGHVKEKIGGKAKAMLVTRSRLHAVRYKQELDRQMGGRKLPYKVLVAFSGEVTDPETGLKFTEQGMNGLPESQTAETFKASPYRFLIVAEKYQTGFDEPLLHTMYVDKKLGGVNAIQTLSRLNRIHPDKDDTMVLDFVNEAGDIQKAFQPYFETTLLTEPTDPNKLYDLKRMVEDYHIFGSDEVDDFAMVYFSAEGKQEQVQPLLDAVVVVYEGRSEEERADFRKHVSDYVRLYAFLSQVLTFTDVELEKIYQYTRHLLRKLKLPKSPLPVEITENINMESYRIQQTSSGAIKLMNEDGELKPIGALGTGRPTRQDEAPLSEILSYINEHYGTDFTGEDRVQHFAADMDRRLQEVEGLRRAMDSRLNPSEDTRRLAFDSFFGDALEDMIDSNFEIYKKIKDDPNFGALFRAVMYRRIASQLAAPPVSRV